MLSKIFILSFFFIQILNAEYYYINQEKYIKNSKIPTFNIKFNNKNFIVEKISKNDYIFYYKKNTDIKSLKENSLNIILLQEKTNKIRKSKKQKIKKIKKKSKCIIKKKQKTKKTNFKNKPMKNLKDTSKIIKITKKSNQNNKQQCNFIKNNNYNLEDFNYLEYDINENLKKQKKEFIKNYKSTILSNEKNQIQFIKNNKKRISKCDNTFIKKYYKTISKCDKKIQIKTMLEKCYKY